MSDYERGVSAAASIYQEILNEYVAENRALRKELAKARDPQRIGGQADPESFTYAIEQLREFRWQHATNDEDTIPYINNVAAAHERELAELRELLRMFRHCAQQGKCANCEFFAGNDGCGERIWERYDELGMEVD